MIDSIKSFYLVMGLLATLLLFLYLEQGGRERSIWKAVDGVLTVFALPADIFMWVVGSLVGYFSRMYGLKLAVNRLSECVEDVDVVGKFFMYPIVEYDGRTYIIWRVKSLYRLCRDITDKYGRCTDYRYEQGYKWFYCELEMEYMDIVYRWSVCYGKVGEVYPTRFAKGMEGEEEAEAKIMLGVHDINGGSSDLLFLKDVVMELRNRYSSMYEGLVFIIPFLAQVVGTVCVVYIELSLTTKFGSTLEDITTHIMQRYIEESLMK